MAARKTAQGKDDPQFYTKGEAENPSTITITASANRRRAGMSFAKGETQIDPDKLTANQLEAIEQDPVLKITE